MEEYNTKRCTKCGIRLAATAEYFVIDKRRPDGMGSWCRKCSRAAVLRSQRLNPQKERERQNAWAATHRAIKRDRARRWDKEHPDTARLRRQRFKENNPDYWNNWAKDNVDKIRQASQRWSRNNPDKMRAKVQRREARKRTLPMTLTPQEWENIKAEFNYACAYCGKGWFEIDGILEQDHIIPLAQDGGYTKENIVPACGRCNKSKGGRTPEQAGMTIRRP